MDGLLDFIRDLLTVRTVWVDKGQGRWVARRRMHPLSRLLVWGGALAVAAWSATSWIDGGPPQEPPEPPAPSMVEVTVTSLDALADASGDDGPALAMIPDGVRVGIDDEDPTGLFGPFPEERPASPDVAIEPDAEPRPEPGGQRKARGPRPAPGYWIRVTKGEYSLEVLSGDEPVERYLIAVGSNPGDKQRVGDRRTPVGDFRVRSIEDSSKWSHDFGDGKGTIDGAYGPWFIRLDAKGWKGIGIHGTHDPDSRGTMATEGCIRMSNDDILDLRRYVSRNTRVVIEE